MGRFSTVMVPTSTKTIEMTIATMGRLIKNFDIALPSLSFRAEWLGGHLHAGSYFLNAFGKTRITARTLPYPPGRRMFAGLGNNPAMRIAPVLSFTWRSAK